MPPTENGWRSRFASDTIQWAAPDDLLANPMNARRHPGEQREAILESLDTLGWVAPLTVNVTTNRLLDGHARTEEAITAGAPLVPFIEVELSEAEEHRVLATLDPISAMAVTDAEVWASLTGGLEVGDATRAMLDRVGAEALLPDGLGDGGGEGAAGQLDPPGPSLADRFIVPPFSVLDARQGYWQARKAEWLALGIRSEEGRNENLLHMSDSIRDVWEGGTSVFDPVLCELVYRWYCPPAGTILDPFAGGSVRGAVASRLGRFYEGVELRPEQVKSNEEQADELGLSPRPVWRQGDALEVLAEGLDPAAEYDLVFSCPPYFDLEEYSDDPADLSQMEWPAFREAYAEIIRLAVARLAPDAFACFVVADVRDKAGLYRGLPQATVAAFAAAGAGLYCDSVLVQPIGSAYLRAGRIFSAGRKLVKTHQEVLVFVKGNPGKAAARLGDVDVSDALDVVAYSEALDEPAA